MTWFMLPAVVGILVKLFLLLGARRNDFISRPVVYLVAILALHNLSEILLFNSFVAKIDANYLIRVYYVCCISVSAYALYYSLSLSKYNTKLIVTCLCALPALSLAAIVLASNFVVTGATELSYSVTAIKGSLYWLYLAYALVAGLTTLSFLGLTYRNSDTPEREVRNFYALLSVVPLALVTVVVVLLMSLGVAVNATFVVPIASTAFLLILVRGKYSSDLSRDPRGYVPNSLEGQLSAMISQANTQYSLEKISHKELMATLEKAAIQYKYLKNDRNVSRTASSMKLERSTLYNKFKALEVRESIDPA